MLAQKVTTPEELDKAMKKVQPAMQAAQKAIKSEAYADVKPQLATIRQVMVDRENSGSSTRRTMR